MIEPLRYRPTGPDSGAKRYQQFHKPPLCVTCKRKRKKNCTSPEVLAKWVCPACNGKPLCDACDKKVHSRRKCHGHTRDAVVVGKGWTKDTLANGDTATFPGVHDWVTVKYKCIHKKTGEVLDDSYSKTHLKHQPMKFQAGCSGPCIHLQVGVEGSVSLASLAAQ